MNQAELERSPVRSRNGKLRVLVIDDNPDDRVLLADFLGQQEYRVYVAADGLDGVRKTQLVQPDLILMDITLPICDGLAACRQIKANPATQAIPLIFVTAAVEPLERVAGLMAGAIDYILKPYDLEELRLRLKIHMLNKAVRPHEDDSVVVHETARNLDVVLFRSARAIVHANLAETPDMQALAKSVGTNARRLTLAFQRCVGLSAAEYVREKRLKKARQLLTETSLEVGSIAEMVGFSGGANFSTAFRLRFGVTPSNLRQSRRTGAPHGFHPDSCGTA